MDFLTEYDDVGSLPTKAAVAYMFLDLFKVQLKSTETTTRGLHWCLKAVATNLDDECLVAFKAYLKDKKAELRKGETKNCSKIVWFLYHKLLEHDAFDYATRQDIISYMDICQYIIL
jgi:hypothetical protein